MNKSPEIVTPRLVLQAVQVEDAADIYDYVRNPIVLRYTTGRTPTEFGETESFVRGLTDTHDGSYTWAIRKQGHAPVIGVVEFDTQGNGEKGVVDYGLSAEFWNQGIMTEAVQAVLDWAFRKMPVLDSVSSSAMTANPASTRVQQKCGMRFVRHEHRKWEKFEEPVELAIFMVTRGEWMAANQGLEDTVHDDAESST